MFECLVKGVALTFLFDSHYFCANFSCAIALKICMVIDFFKNLLLQKYIKIKFNVFFNTEFLFN